MNNLTVWNYSNSEVRTVSINNEPWWVLADVCKILEITRGSKVAERLEEDEVRQTSITDSIGRQQNTYIVNESGLYSVILRSDKPQAKPFRKWVTSEVLPSIRKHGIYAVDDVLNNPDVWITALQELKAEREKTKQLTQTVAIQTQQIAEMQPKASYYDLVLNCKDLISISVIAKDYGKSAKWLNNFLHERKIWLLNQKYAENGYTSTKTHTVNGNDGEVHPKVHTYWTQKGRLFIYDLLKTNGILPLIEREEKVA
ncbi:MAG: phage antirepressor [Acutalibacteraceae bacterium]